MTDGGRDRVTEVRCEPNRPATPALQFSEHLAGHISLALGPDGDFGAAAAIGRATNCCLSTNLTIAYADLPAVLADPSVQAAISGTIHAPLLSTEPLKVSSGTFVLLAPDPAHVETDHMLYRCDALASDGRQFRFEGFKVIRQGPATKAWRDTTTLFVTIHEVRGRGPVAECARGIIRVTLGDLRRLLGSIEILNVPKRQQQDRYRREFLSRFLGSLWPFFAGAIDEPGRFPVPTAKPRPVRESNGMAVDTVRWCDPAGAWHDDAPPGACSRLIRYQGGEKGPVMLAPGFAMSATSFALETNRPNLVSYLRDRGFDVWLFDYRAGIDLPSSWTQSTIDQIANIDWPRAVAEVRRMSRAPDVQALGHCVGSVSLMMTLLSGTPGIRSAICAQFTVHPMTSILNKTKALLHIGTAMADLGISRVRPDSPRHLSDVALDLAIRPIPMPRGERCGLAVCRWINAIFGCTHVHEQLDDATHNEIPTMFGVGNLTGLRHLILMLQRGRAVDAWGLNRYLPHVERLDLPIHFLAGTQNYIFHPSGTERTLEWLHSAHGSVKSSHNYSVNYLEGYGHLDAIIGRDASIDVFPDIAEHLEQYSLSSA